MDKASGLIKGIGEKTAAEIVARFGVNALDILENHPEKLLEIRGITEKKLEDIRTSYAESRSLRDIMTLLAPFKLTPATAQKIYQFFGADSVKILKENPFELCRGIPAPARSVEGEDQKDYDKSFTLTRRSNLVAVVTDGTAVLGPGGNCPKNTCAERAGEGSEDG